MPATASSFGLYFDITRRLDEESGEMASGTGVFSNISNDMFSPQVEMPNDDSMSFDEDIVTSFPTLYSYDASASEIGMVQPQGATSPNSYVKWIGDFEEFVRVSFSPIPAVNPGSEQVHGTRCSDLVKWCHGRTLVAKAGLGAIDPYITSSQKLEVIKSASTYSTPIRLMGNGNGNINVTLLPNATTQGYSLFFPSNLRCELRNGSNVIQSVLINNQVWTLEDSGKIKVTVSNNSTNPFVMGTQLDFSTLVSARLFNAVKIR